MKMTIGEQICRKHVKRPYRYERWLKKVSSRIMRRLARQDAANAPTKLRYTGYSD